MDETPIAELSINRSPIVYGNEGGYDLWFDLAPKTEEGTTVELQTLCQGSMLLGRIAERMGWDWTTLIRNIDHLSAPLDGFLLLEVEGPLFNSARFREVLLEGVGTCGLNPAKVRVVNEDSANAYVLAHGLPPLDAFPRH